MLDHRLSSCAADGGSSQAEGMDKQIRVAIIGAGPAGLVQARTFLRYPLSNFTVTVFERKSSIGGLWPLEADQHDRVLDPHMRTNLSKHTCSFSDFAWDDVSLPGLEKLEGSRDAPNRFMFPKAWHVGRYLQAYTKRYIPDHVILFNSTVVRTAREELDGGPQWRVDWTCSDQAGAPNVIDRSNLRTQAVARSVLSDGSGTIYSAHFDRLVVATGFFAGPKMVPDLPGLKDYQGTVIHSTQLRQLQSLLERASSKPAPASGSDEENTPTKIVVVGGGLSSVEAAASLAFQASSRQYSPSSVTDDSVLPLEIFHVCPRPFWSMRLALPTDPVTRRKDSPAFLPLDLRMNDIAARPSGEIKAGGAVGTPESATNFNKFFESILGSDQSDLGQGGQVAVTNAWKDKPVHVAISDTYADFIRSGDITYVTGRATSVELSTEKSRHCTLMITNDRVAQKQAIEDVSIIILATGFVPHPSLSFLPPEVLNRLSYDPSSDRLPLLLHHHSTINPSVPNLGFVGFYQSPYWGIMEMQSRFLARHWSDPFPNAFLEQANEESELLELRHLLKTHDEKVAQFTMGDYVGIMEEFHAMLDLPPRLPMSGDAGDNRWGPIVAARYPMDNDILKRDLHLRQDSSLTEKPGDDYGVQQSIAAADDPPDDSRNVPLSRAQQCLNSLRAAISPPFANATTFLPRATFFALQGRWQLTRTLRSSLPTYPSGTFTGTASFHPRYPTDPAYYAEYLYVENGTLILDSGGPPIQGTRRYVYRYDEFKDELSAWFVKPEDGKTVDYLFHRLEFGEPEDGIGNERWEAKGHHLCEKDDYDAAYEFAFKGVAIESFQVGYGVKGPKKDYTAEARYRR